MMTDDSRPRIDLYCLCWNDARMLPHFFRHYDELVGRYFVFDAGSTDDSVALLEAHPRVTLGHVDLTEHSYTDAERRLSDTFWKRSRGAAEWIILVGIHEFIVHADIKDYLARCSASGITAVRAVGYDMVAEAFPEEGASLVATVTRGVRADTYDKLCIFNPDALTDMYFAQGRRDPAPTGQAVLPEEPEVLLLNYESLGLDYTVRRSAERRLGLPSEEDVPFETWNSADVAERFEALEREAELVPGLGFSPEPLPLANGHEFPSYEQVVAALSHDPRAADPNSPLLEVLRMFVRSVAVDEEAYRRAYPDVAQAIEAGSFPSAQQHFVDFGYFEGRNPRP